MLADWIEKIPQGGPCFGCSCARGVKAHHRQARMLEQRDQAKHPFGQSASPIRMRRNEIYLAELHKGVRGIEPANCDRKK